MNQLVNVPLAVGKYSTTESEDSQPGVRHTH